MLSKHNYAVETNILLFLFINHCDLRITSYQPAAHI